MTLRTRDKRFGVILIPTWNCNNTCTHCFEQLGPGTVTDGFWQLFYQRLREFGEANHIDRFVVYWQGGEVLTMPPTEVERGLRLGEAAFQGSDTVLEHHLQTNLILYSRQWREIIAEFFRGAISSSLDFPNLYRSAPSITVDEYTTEWLRKKTEAEADGFLVNLITLPNPRTLEVGARAFYQFFHDHVRIQNLQINFPFPGVQANHPEQLDLGGLADFMLSLYTLWVDEGRQMTINPFDALENRLMRDEGTLPCAWSYSCANYLISVGPDGEVGQCDCWLSTRKQHSFGHLADRTIAELLESPSRRPFLERGSHMIRDAHCGACEFWSICFGGCPLRAFTFSNDFLSRDYYCPVYRSMCEAVVDRRAQLQQRGIEAAIGS
jgi:uncharacterized protein